MSNTLSIGSRRSRLAMVQSEYIAGILRERAQVECIIVPIDTRGDQVLDKSLPEIGGKGLFTEELEQRLLSGAIDIAVHSLKDLPGDLPDGLTVGAISSREDPRDALVSTGDVCFRDLPRGARVGTGSVRRRAQLMMMRPDVELLPIRGNVQTRFAKLEAGNYDAILLAAAGLKRLDLSNRITEYFSPEELLPAPGQGALGVECRSDDQRVLALLSEHVNNTFASYCCRAERSVMRAMQAGCSAPFAAYATISQKSLRLTSFAASLDAQRCIRSTHEGAATDFESIAAKVVAEMESQGAAQLLSDSRDQE